MSAPPLERRFGPYGGRYVPETLIPALDELEAAWTDARDDPAFVAELDELLRDYVGRPTPLYHAQRLSELAGGAVWLKREDLTHTGSHKINNAIGQALLAKRMGKPRVIAETGAGQHGVAAATACALLGLDCVVYMGTEDMRRQEPNVQRMRLLGAEVRGVDAGARTLKEAVSAAIRDWVANVATTHYVIGSCVGPAPYPALVRDLQRRIGDEAREQLLDQAGRLPDRAIACVGGGSNAIGTFIPFVDDAEVELIGVEAAGDGLLDADATPRRSRPARAACCTEPSPACCRTRPGQILEAHSISAGLDYPGVGPEHAWLRDSGRVRYEAVEDGAALEAFHRVAQLEGILPALESVARDRVAAREPLSRARASSRCRAGATRTSPRCLRSDEHRTSPFADILGARQARRSDAVPDGRLSEHRGVGRGGAGGRRRGRGSARARDPVLRSAGGRAGDPRGGTEALAAGATPHGVLGVCERLAERVPVVLMVYANIVLHRGRVRLRAEGRGRRGRRG